MLTCNMLARLTIRVAADVFLGPTRACGLCQGYGAGSFMSGWREVGGWGEDNPVGSHVDSSRMNHPRYLLWQKSPYKHRLGQLK